MRSRRTFAGAVALLLSASAAQAQIGHPPSSSPYEDQKIGQTLTISAGYLRTGTDPANVRPNPSPMFGVRYDASIGGPTAVYGRYMVAPSDRRQLIPTRPAATRLDATPAILTHMFDIGLDMSLTGNKSWRRLMPSVNGGLGIVSDFKSADAGGYKFGTNFTIAYGVAVRYMTASRLSLRAELTNYMWEYSYPDAYFVPGADQTSVLSQTRQRTAWRNNFGFTLGASWLLFR